MILTPDDRTIFFPSVNLEENTLLGFLVRAQAIAESLIGANRPLELQPHVFHLEIPASVFFIPNTPIAPEPIPVIEQRVSRNPYPHSFGYQQVGRGYGYGCHSRFPGIARARNNVGIFPQDIQPIGTGNDWQIIPVEQYEIDLETGRVELRYWAIATSLKVTYTGGYDFSTSSPEVLAIKSAVAAILKHLLYSDGLIGAVEANTTDSQGVNGGVPIEIDVVDDIKVKYPDLSDSKDLISKAYDDALKFLSSFRKRRVYAT